MPVSPASVKNRKRVPNLKNGPSGPAKQAPAVARRRTVHAVLNPGPTFWNTSFAPLVEAIAVEAETTQIESEFFGSLSIFARLMGLSLPDRQTLGFYPMNVDAAFLLAKEHLATVNPRARLEIILDEQNRTRLCAFEFAKTDYEVYHIGLGAALNELDGQPFTPATALLSAILAYLVQVAGVAFFGDERSYPNGEVDMVKEYFDENLYDLNHQTDGDYTDEIEEYTEGIATIKNYQLIGSRMYKVLSEPHHLTGFGPLVAGFVPQTPAEERLLDVAHDFWAIYQSYPHETIFSAVEGAEALLEEESYFGPDMSVCIYPSRKDALYGEIENRMQCDAQEVGVLPPLTYRCFTDSCPDTDLTSYFANGFYRAFDKLDSYLNLTY